MHEQGARGKRTHAFKAPKSHSLQQPICYDVWTKPSFSIAFILFSFVPLFHNRILFLKSSKLENKDDNGVIVYLRQWWLSHTALTIAIVSELKHTEKTMKQIKKIIYKLFLSKHVFQSLSIISGKQSFINKESRHMQILQEIIELQGWWSFIYRSTPSCETCIWWPA